MKNKYDLQELVYIPHIKKWGIVEDIKFQYHFTRSKHINVYTVNYATPMPEHTYAMEGRRIDVDEDLIEKKDFLEIKKDFVFNFNLTTEQMLEGYIKELEKNIYKSFGIDPNTLFPKTGTDDALDAMKYALATRTLTSNVIYDSPHNYEINDIAIRLLRAKDIPIKQCLNGHKWKTYEGFTSKYDYCEHCDEKKDLND